MYKLLFLLFLALPFSAYSDSILQLKNEMQQQQFSQAVNTGLALLQTSPENEQALFLTALAFQQNKQPQEALKYYRQLIQRNPDLPEPLNNIALIHLQQGNHDQAADALIASLNTHPAYATAWQNLSNLYQGLASEAYRKALGEENQTGHGLDNIQLASLNELHSLQHTKHDNLKKDITPIQLAAAPIPESSTSIESAIERKNDLQQAQLSDRQQEQKLVDTIKNWADKWSNKNFEAYVDAYTKNYKGRRSSHQSWVKYRQSRILRLGSIEVKVDNIQIKSRNKERAIVDFEQTFKSSSYRDKVLKRITLVLQDNLWKISQERTLSVL